MFAQACHVQPQMQRSAVLPDGMSSNPKADFYIAWATNHNSAAYHSPMHGSWFAVALYECVSHVVFMCFQYTQLFAHLVTHVTTDSTDKLALNLPSIVRIV